MRGARARRVVQSTLAAVSGRVRRTSAGLGPVFELEGELLLGDDVHVAFGPVATQIVVAPGGVCRLGDRVFVGHGSSISCDLEVTIGTGTRLGPFSMVYDSDFHTIGAHDLRYEAESAAAPPPTGAVHIGSNVMIGECATILRGTTIGDDTVVEPGSVVWGAVPAGSTVSGRPQPAGT